MNGHLCLKWNNHSTSFLKSIGNIQAKERYCDATITCQGKFFPVHRIVLSTCSDYFEEIFERIQNQHPYIVFKDIEPKEMELLLNYMYQGEVNVLQENLPTLIKAAEALRIKGLAVPDDLPSKDTPSSRKRSNTFSDNSQSKRRAEERRRKGDLIENHDKHSFLSEDSQKHIDGRDIDNTNEPRIKEEPVDTGYEDNFPLTTPSHMDKDPTMENSGSEFTDFLESDNSSVKNENVTQDESYENKPTSWGESSFEGGDQLESLTTANLQEDIIGAWQGSGHDLSSQHQSSFVNNSGLLNLSSENQQRDSNLKHQCPFCLYKSKFKPHIKRHIMFKHTKERPFLCTFCTRRFTNKESLQRHTLIHTGEKPYQCPRCLTRFRHCSSLKIHRQNNPDCLLLISEIENRQDKI